MKLIWGLVLFLFFMRPMGEVYAFNRVELRIESIQIQPPRPSQSKPVTIVATVRNNGSQEAKEFYVSVSVLHRGKKVKAIESVPVISTLPRGGSGLSVPVNVGTLATGSYSALVQVHESIEPDDKPDFRKSRTKNFRVYDKAFPVSY